MSAVTKSKVKKNEARNKLLTGDLVLLIMVIILGLITYYLLKAFMYFLPNYLIISVVMGLISFYISLCLTALAMPKLKPGTYPLRDPRVSIWFIGYIFSRIWNYELIRHPIFAFAFLRIVFFKCLGSKISSDTILSLDSAISDPYLIEIEDGCTVGMGTYLVPHYIAKGNLVLSPIKIGKNVMVGAWSRIGPGVTIGDNTSLDVDVSLLPHVSIPKDCKIQIGAILDRSVPLTEGCIIPPYFLNSKK